VSARDQYFFVFAFFVGAFFSPLGAIVPVVSVPVVPMVPMVPEVLVMVIAVPVVAVELVVVVPVVLLDVTPVSVAAVSVFALSSFLQLNAKIAMAASAIRVSNRDFFICGLSSFFVRRQLRVGKM
jgi:hypothetical protein